MTPVEICQGLGEARTRSFFLELTTEAMKKVLREAKVSTLRLASHTSTRKRNEDWAGRLWRVLAEPGSTAKAAAAVLLFEWLTRARRTMLADFLTRCGVQNDRGLTDADFMKQTPPEKLVEAGEALFAKFPPPEVAAYLLFLDASNGSQVFEGMGLDKRLAEG